MEHPNCGTSQSRSIKVSARSRRLRSIRVIMPQVVIEVGVFRWSRFLEAVMSSPTKTLDRKEEHACHNNEPKCKLLKYVKT